MIHTGLIQCMPIGARIVQVFNPVKRCWVDVNFEGEDIISSNNDEFVFYVQATSAYEGFPGFLSRISINRDTTVKWEI